ncbi:alpha/beta fold hydrolase [Sulfitobacter sp. JBTF-M27]|uniref:Alpha/beta fold hydrolase n=1 Tax=Sulfitobacter sediminilitoris TaxID=2698830 RepID=A0A6P0CFK5_9RHOB|nr:alpha/beta hydrolase [Sulfitobacter sediminilitoris]NEK24939.1 alpha/beta fold hydrolase [Sulfitobacter sediminilitoris]
MEIQTIIANGIRLALEDHGPKDATPLVLIRGQGSQMAHWPRELIDGLVSAGFRTIAFDNRDVGLSQRCPVSGAPSDAEEILRLLRKGEAITAPYGPEDMARDVTGLMDALGLEEAHVFGISMGGMITQQLMLQAPERLLSATIVMSSCRPMFEPNSPDDVGLIARAEQLLARPQSREEYLMSQIEEHAKWGSPGYPMPEADIRAMGEIAYDRGVDAEGLNRQLLAIVNATDRRPGLAKTEVPCLVVHGEEDALVPLASGKEIAEVVPGSEFLPVPGMGHIITPRLAPLIVQAVTDFIFRRASG